MAVRDTGVRGAGRRGILAAAALLFAAVPPLGAEGLYPLTVSDSLGRTLTIPSVPRRILSLDPGHTEVLFAIGAGSQMAGVTTRCDRPEIPKTVRRVKWMPGDAVDTAGIIGLKPDLVFALAGSHSESVNSLQRAGITVFASEPETLDGVFAEIELFGTLTGNQEKARATTAAMRARMNAVRWKLSLIPQADRPLVYWEVSRDPLRVAGGGSWITDLIMFAGGRNAFQDLPGAFPGVSVEEIAARDPAVLMAADNEEPLLSLRTLRSCAGWDGITGVIRNRIYVVNEEIVLRAGPRLVEGVEAIARALHPEYF
jgi:iron complex transport system substrate-binding protein